MYFSREKPGDVLVMFNDASDSVFAFTMSLFLHPQHRSMIPHLRHLDFVLRGGGSALWILMLWGLFLQPFSSTSAIEDIVNATTLLPHSSRPKKIGILVYKVHQVCDLVE